MADHACDLINLYSVSVDFSSRSVNVCRLGTNTRYTW
jgi:hypothetical protein